MIEPSRSKLEDEIELARLFGVEHNSLKRLILRRGKSQLYTREKIAQVLLSNSLVDNLEEGLKEVDSILARGRIGNAYWILHKPRDGETKHQLTYFTPSMEYY